MITDENFSQLIERYKQTLKYYPGRLCSCIGENNGIPKIDCGCTLGYWYDRDETIIGIRKDISYKYTNSPQGVIFDGGAQFIIPKKYKGIEQKAYQMLNKGDIISVIGKYRRDRDILRKGIRDKLYAFDVVDIISVSQKNIVYIKDQDFRLENNEIKWIGNNYPPEESYYTVEFTCNQQYIIWENGVRDRGTDTKELPRSVITVLRHYAQAVQQNPIDSIDLNEQF